MSLPLKDGPTRAGAAAAAAERPFVIWTLQRTGGTNLTHHLKRRSAFGMAEHEPFNPPRSYGHVTRAWKRDRDDAALAAAVEAVCARRENIKHCLEMVPRKVSEALLVAARAAGYRHLFLHRRDAVGRLLSMEYAQRTKVWGPRLAETAAEDARAFATPLDVPALIAHEARCVALMTWAWRRLRAAGAAPVAIAYEEVYGTDATLAAAALARVLHGLALARGPAADTALLADLRARGDQQTRDRYARFENVEALRAGVAALPTPRFADQPAGED